MGRALDFQELDDVVQLVTKGSKAPASTLRRVAEAQRAALVAELRRYGEDAVALKIESLPASKVESIHARGMKIAFTGIMLLTALCLAAVEEVEGSSRPLARKRRKPAT
jgi:hypothetical protein